MWHNKGISSTYHSCCSVPGWKEAREGGGRLLVTQLPVLCFHRVFPKHPSSLKQSCSEWRPGSWHPTPSSLKRFWSAGRAEEIWVGTLLSQQFEKILRKPYATPSQHTWQLQVPQRHGERRREERLQAEDLQRVPEPRRSLDAGTTFECTCWSRFIVWKWRLNDWRGRQRSDHLIFLPRMSWSLATSTHLTSSFLSSWIHLAMENCKTFHTMSYW